MKFHQLFIASFYQPKKLASFRLLPIGKVIGYVFILITAFTLISFSRYFFGEIEWFETSTELEQYSQQIGLLLYPVAFLLQFVISTFYLFIRVSLFAYIGLLIGQYFLKKRVAYQQIWRTAAISITVPFLCTLFFDLNPQWQTKGILLSSVVHIMYILAALRYYPKQQLSKKSTNV